MTEPFVSLAELQEPCRTLVLIASTTGLRRGELFGLKWEDLDFKRGKIPIVRLIVDQMEGATKTAGSRSGINEQLDLCGPTLFLLRQILSLSY
jgi:integrase